MKNITKDALFVVGLVLAMMMLLYSLVHWSTTHAEATATTGPSADLTEQVSKLYQQIEDLNTRLQRLEVSRAYWVGRLEQRQIDEDEFTSTCLDNILERKLPHERHRYFRVGPENDTCRE
jgi:hypothetical protein